MSKFLDRLKKNQKKGISPAIATIILIVVALVIALLVGVFAFGLFTSQTTSLSVQSGNIYVVTGGASVNFVFTLKNPGTAASTTPTVTLSGPGLTASPEICTSGTPLLAPVGGGATLTMSCTGAGTGLTTGNTFNYVINVNSQSISGSVVSQ